MKRPADRIGLPIEALRLFDKAKSYVESSPSLRSELMWQRTRNIEAVSESDFLRESAWVILCGGFKEATVRRWFSYISLCFCDWESAQSIVKQGDRCVSSARQAINHLPKLQAIVTAAEIVVETGFDEVHRRLASESFGYLERYPYIGPITSRHLAKNLGAPVAKADRHLIRLSTHFGFDDVDQFCAEIGRARNEPIEVVDLILWRFSADNPKSQNNPRQTTISLLG